MNIPLFKVFVAREVKEHLAEVLNSGYIGQGPVVDQFEKALALALQSPRVVTVNSGTSGIHLVLQTLKSLGRLKRGEEIASSPLTCFATNAPLFLEGFRIRWLDIDPTTLNVDLSQFPNDVSTAMIVHWGGSPVDLTRIPSGVNVIEDCAHAWGALFQSRPLSLASPYPQIYSFQAIKHLTCGDGGCVVWKDSESEALSRLLRWYGMDRSGDRVELRCVDDVSVCGTKLHMNDLNASIGLSNLKHSGWILQRHRSNAAFYDEALLDVPGLQLLKRDPNSSPSFWIYSLLVDDRDGFQRKMKEHGISTNHVHERNDRYSCFSQFRRDLPQLDWVERHITHLPVGWWVGSEERSYIVDCVRKGW